MTSVRTLAVPDRLIEHGSTVAGLGLDAEGIAAAVTELVERRRGGSAAGSGS